MKLWQTFRNLSRLRQIVFVVLSFHLVFVFSLFCNHFIKKSSKTTPTHIAVRTVRPQPPPTPQPQRRTIAASPPATKKSIPPKQEKAKTVAAPAIKKSAAPKKIIPVSVEKKVEKEAPPEVVEEAPLPFTPRPKLQLPRQIQIPSFVQQEEETSSESSYGDILAAFLQSALELPEHGEVKVKLEIDPTGELRHFEILEARNQKNGEFLQQALKELRFPEPPQDGNREVCWTITFKNRN